MDDIRIKFDKVVEYINDELYELDKVIEAYEEESSYVSIKNIDDFKFELSKNGLDSEELLKFIDDYIKFKND